MTSLAGVMYRKILVAADGSATAARAVDRAADIASATGAGVTILTVGKDADAALRTAQAAADRIAAATAGAVVPQAKVDHGEPAEVIVDEARTGGYDLLVVGNKGMTGAGRLLGSVPNSISHHAPCAVLIVRTS